jgi:hypothetical protein
MSALASKSRENTLSDYQATTQKEWRREKINISLNIAPFLKMRPWEESWNQGIQRDLLRISNHKES